jgi:hypothetical protein
MRRLVRDLVAGALLVLFADGLAVMTWMFALRMAESAGLWAVGAFATMLLWGSALLIWLWAIGDAWGRRRG